MIKVNKEIQKTNDSQIVRRGLKEHSQVVKITGCNFPEYNGEFIVRIKP